MHEDGRIGDAQLRFLGSFFGALLCAVFVPLFWRVLLRGSAFVFRFVLCPCFGVFWPQFRFSCFRFRVSLVRVRGPLGRFPVLEASIRSRLVSRICWVEGAAQALFGPAVMLWCSSQELQKQMGLYKQELLFLEDQLLEVSMENAFILFLFESYHC